MKIIPHPISSFTESSYLDPSPPFGTTNENNMAHRTGQNRQQFSLPYRMTIATPLDEMFACFFEVFDLAALRTASYSLDGRKISAWCGWFTGRWSPFGREGWGFFHHLRSLPY